MGAGKCLNEREKNSGEEKSRTKIRAPGDKVLTDQFQTVVVVLASDWCQKTFVFFCPITEQQGQESIRSFPTQKEHTGLLLAIFVWVAR